MKHLFALIALVLSVSAFAKEKISFGYSGMEGWGRTFYACDYVEAQTENILELFGATEISVRCTGGIQYGQMWPVQVTAYFEAPVLVGNEMNTITKIQGDFSNPACGLNTTIVKNLLPSFKNVEVLKKSDSCAFASSNYSYTFAITK
jgi:hypothetical protein